MSRWRPVIWDALGGHPYLVAATLLPIAGGGDGLGVLGPLTDDVRTIRLLVLADHLRADKPPGGSSAKRSPPRRGFRAARPLAVRAQNARTPDAVTAIIHVLAVPRRMSPGLSERVALSAPTQFRAVRPLSARAQNACAPDAETAIIIL